MFEFCIGQTFQTLELLEARVCPIVNFTILELVDVGASWPDIRLLNKEKTSIKELNIKTLIGGLIQLLERCSYEKDKEFLKPCGRQLAKIDQTK